ncbi:MAG: (deoxy)nucleoside triphosphate pyrophosphohydrolase [Sphingomonas sp.]|uniref:(deoxy)nucleoside triphosphate pyrophosphohydrolase n=1 Tax=Sphingomonas sp. TaxID=28214 RepID=UPI001AC6B552|nr:(deoxy)nucleoside triphosphate pyrophosphohydrolase [Sphingomonas sp.]MBN8814644.1 (deoxy)nucleoside triphosphate pyrophosphohydrolase [Sphingomonas sp.]
MLIVVAAALTDGEGCVLMARRPAGKQHAGLWEFPGGKVEPGEKPAAALARELREELAIEVERSALVPVAFSESASHRHLVLLLYRCRSWRGEPQPLDAAEIRWVAVDRLTELDMPPADRPLAKALAAER